MAVAKNISYNERKKRDIAADAAEVRRSIDVFEHNTDCYEL